MALGSAVSGHPTAQLVLLGVGVFVSLYLFGVSYILAMAGITTILAVIYDLMGQFSDQVLELRVAETAIGVALGGLAAMVVFPMSSRGKIRESENDLLEELQKFVDKLADPRAVHAHRASCATTPAPSSRKPTICAWRPSPWPNPSRDRLRPTAPTGGHAHRTGPLGASTGAGVLRRPGRPSRLCGPRGHRGAVVPAAGGAFGDRRLPTDPGPLRIPCGRTDRARAAAHRAGAGRHV